MTPNHKLPEGFTEIPGFPGYYIDETGVIVSSAAPTIPLKYRQTASNSCFTVQLQNSAKKYGQYRVCALVMLTFKDEPLRKGARIIHIDGNIRNHRPNNLRYRAPSKRAEPQRTLAQIREDTAKREMEFNARMKAVRRQSTYQSTCALYERAQIDKAVELYGLGWTDYDFLSHRTGIPVWHMDVVLNIWPD